MKNHFQFNHFHLSISEFYQLPQDLDRATMTALNRVDQLNSNLPPNSTSKGAELTKSTRLLSIWGICQAYYMLSIEPMLHLYSSWALNRIKTQSQNHVKFFCKYESQQYIPFLKFISFSRRHCLLAYVIHSLYKWLF